MIFSQAQISCLRVLFFNIIGANLPKKLQRKCPVHTKCVI